MNYCVIDGIKYDVIVKSIEESFTILYTDNTGRTIAPGAPLTLDPLGTFFSHKVVFKRNKENFAEFDRLYDFLTVPRYQGFPIEIVHDQDTIKYEAYASNGTRLLQRISKDFRKVFWGELSVNFVPIKAQVIPV